MCEGEKNKGKKGIKRRKKCGTCVEDKKRGKKRKKTKEGNGITIFSQ